MSWGTGGSGMIRGYRIRYCPKCKRDTSQKPMPAGWYCNRHKGVIPKIEEKGES